MSDRVLLVVAGLAGLGAVWLIVAALREQAREARVIDELFDGWWRVADDRDDDDAQDR